MTYISFSVFPSVRRRNVSCLPPALSPFPKTRRNFSVFDDPVRVKLQPFDFQSLSSRSRSRSILLYDRLDPLLVMLVRNATVSCKFGIRVSLSLPLPLSPPPSLFQNFLPTEFSFHFSYHYLFIMYNSRHWVWNAAR